MKKLVAIIIGGTGQFGITISKKLLKKNEIKIKSSDCFYGFKKNNIITKPKIYGKKIIELMIKYYLSEKKY